MSSWRLRQDALQDLQVIGDLIVADNPAHAVSFIDELLALCARIAEQPRVYRRGDDLAPGLRQTIHGRCLILLTADEEGIVVEVYRAQRAPP